MENKTKKNNHHAKSNSIDLSVITNNIHNHNSSLISSASLIFKPSPHNSNNSTVNKSPLIDEKYLINEKLPYDEYKKKLKFIMEDYKYEDKEDLTGTDRRSTRFGDFTQKEKLNNFLNKNKRKQLNMTSLMHPSEDSMIKINVHEEDFKSPFHSMNVLSKNNIIYNSIVHNYKDRETDKLKNAVKKIHETQVQIPDVSKLRITSLIPKNMEPGNNNSNVKQDSVIMSQMNMLNYNRETHSTDMYAYYVYCKNNFPEGREQFCWSSEANEFILFGGIVSNKSNYIWSLDPSNIEWKKIQAEGIPANLRYGHTGVLYQRRLYVFGGKTKVNNYPYIPDLEIFNLDDRTWTNPVLYTKSTLKLRRNHVAKVVGHHMFVHGGISEDEEYLSDSYLLSFSPLKWQTAVISPDFEAPQLAWHTCCLVLPTDQMYHGKLNIYKLPEQNLGRRMVKMKEKGIYLFGGKSIEDGEYKNDLWVLRIGKKPLEWVKVNTNGISPPPRCAHSMNFYEDGNYVIIHGGRTDSGIDSIALKDTYILELGRLDWIKVNIYFDTIHTNIYNRCGHSSIIYSKE